MLIFDAHLDLAWNALGWNRDVTWPVEEIRASESGMTELGRGTNTVSLPEMCRGEVRLCLATALARWNPQGSSVLDWKSQAIASATARAHFTYYDLLEKAGEIRVIRDAEDLKDAESIGVIFSMEGADPIASPDEVEEWFKLGLRVIGPAHYGVSAYAHGTGSPGGLTDRGPALLKAMRRCGMILDVTHLADQAFWQALEVFDGPVIASHHNCRALVPGDRQLDDSQIRALLKRGAVIGIAMDAWMLSRTGWRRGAESNPVVTLADAVDHIDHICQLAGNCLHTAIGSDLDGGFGTEQCPRDLNTIADLQKLPELLDKRNYRQEDICRIMHGNWLRFFQSAL
jgi:membrane dipeptidase